MSSRAQLEILQGDIADATCDVVVNAWNRNFIPHWLLIPQGVSRALRKRAGREPFREVRRRGLLPLGGAIATGAGRMDARWIVHVAALHAYWRASHKSVALGYANALRVADELGARTIATPLLGAGTGGLKPTESFRLLQCAWSESRGSLVTCQLWIFDRQVHRDVQPGVENELR